MLINGKRYQFKAAENLESEGLQSPDSPHEHMELHC